MGRQRCCNLHFINAIKGDAIIKKRNVIVSGKKSLIFRTVKDIIEKEDAGGEYLEGNGNIIEKRHIVLPVIDRSLRNPEMRGVKHDCLEIGGNPGEDSDGDMTLKQLKQMKKTKKRKHVMSVGPYTEQVCVKLEPVEEDPDLDKSIISFKSKLPKAKRKHVLALAESPEVDISSNLEKDLDNEMQHCMDLSLLHHVKTEDPEPDEGPLPQSINLTDTTASEVMTNQNLETLSYSEGYGSCVLNPISFDHLDNVEPFSESETCEEPIDPSHVEKSCQHLHDYPTSEIETNDNTDLCLDSESPTKFNEVSSIYVSLHGLMEMNCNSSTVTEVPDSRADDCKTNSKEFYHSCDSWQLNGPTSPVSSSANHYTCLGSDETLFSSKDCSVRTSNCFDTASSLVLSEERSSSPTSVDNKHASIHVSAQRILSTRKVVSPSSQERISLAMNSRESHDENESKAKTPKDFDSIREKMGTTSPSILKKPKNGKRRNSLPKGNLEGPRLSRSLENFSTGCTSLKKCSESAIAFSKRQMQDIDSLAMNLMGELKYMKDVIEGKFVSEVRQTSDLKREAEEQSRFDDEMIKQLKEAITHATKTEEKTRKWLSMMSRDCNRFCKIMSMKVSESDDVDVDDSNNNVGHREGKRIAFADETGGILCQVKYFENDMKLNAHIMQQDETQ